MFRRGKYIVILFLIAVVSLGAYSCLEPEPIESRAENEWLAGGSQTVFNSGAGAFRSVFPHLSENLEKVHEVGDVAFEQTFVSRPAQINPGLGPIFNNVSCTSCHINDGRGKPPGPNEQISSLLIRVSVPGTGEHGGPVAVPGFGLQLQQRSIFGVPAEALVKITYTEQQYEFADGEKYSLRTPQYALTDPYIALPADVMISPRIAPPVFGLGLLEAIDESTILANADPNDANDDGISGKPNYVWNVAKDKKTIGRFGWKANNPDVLQQSAGAYSEDMGITNFLFPRESSWQQSQYIEWDGGYDVTDSLLQAVAFYVRTLGVPARRNADNAQVLQGKQIFNAANCSSCHKPQMRTKVDVSFPEISNQVIFPYTDLLLHDMGGGLADNRPDFDATGREWRTSPLWGIGLTQVVNGHQNFLHDGRARTLMEAIMWHGGEAEQSKEYVRTISKSERDALIKFLESL